MMTLLPYAALFVAVSALSATIFSYASRSHDPSKGKDKSWMIGYLSWIAYAVVATVVGGLFGLNLKAGFAIGVAAGFCGSIAGFLYAMWTSKNGVK